MADWWTNDAPASPSASQWWSGDTPASGSAGGVFVDPVTGERHQIVEPGLSRQPGQFTPQDVESRMAYLRQPQPQLPQAPATGAQTAGPGESAEAAAARARDPAFMRRVIEQTPPAQLPNAIATLGAQQVGDFGPAMTGLKSGVNSATFGAFPALTAAGQAIGGGPDYATALKIAQAGDQAAAAAHPEWAQKGGALGAGVSGALVPETLMATPLRAAATSAALGGGGALLQGQSLAEAGKQALVGALVGGPMAGATGELARPGMPDRHALAGVPTTEQLDDAASRGYQAAEATGTEYAPRSFGKMVADAQGVVKGKGFVPSEHAGTNDIFNTLQAAVDSGKPPTVADMNTYRTQINAVANSRLNPPDAFRAGLIKNQFNKFIENAGPADVMQGDPAATAAAWKEANANYAAARRSDLVDAISNNAEWRAAAQDKEPAQGIRNQYAALLGAKTPGGQAKLAQFTPEEQSAMGQVVTSTPGQRALSQVAKWSPMAHGAGGAALTIMAAEHLPELLHNPGAAIAGLGGAVGAGALAGKAGSAANQIVMNRAALVDALVRARSPLAGYANVGATAPQIPQMSPPALPYRVIAPALTDASQGP